MMQPQFTKKYNQSHFLTLDIMLCISYDVMDTGTKHIRRLHIYKAAGNNIKVVSIMSIMSCIT